ncbi:aminotransferase class I/II-fold pyridoxal phosphate-dependent enzyme [Flavobacteriales bacterium]|jgi:methionine-gamma-lyase|nr:aminotransferase class I/II-fold pyridoxal phosphate-dependent enzyme [Flavobacteriales bacterium]MDB2362659.1 aminotransferase class I/II-fold pyridoxal phosphate-dependent enzyme [Flavobacteriales bacterium]
MKKHKPADSIQDIQYFGEYGGVNPSIADSSTFTYMAGKTMEMVFGGEREGCYLYSRHMNPSTGYLAEAIAQMENTEAAHVSASGMGSISSTILQICKSGDHIISSRTIYGGTYAFMKNFLPKLLIDTSFVDTTNLEAVQAAITKNTKIIYCETVSNPLLEVSDIKKLAEIAKQNNLKLVVDNTFTPLVFSPKELGADIVIHSLTKFINGASDTLGGIICSDKEFIGQLIDVNDGAAMLLGPTMDAIRANGILKNLRTLPVRIKQHSYNANYLANKFQELGLKVHYPGLKNHPQHELMKESMNKEFGFGGMLVLDVDTMENAYNVMEEMQNENIGYLAVSLGFYKTLFSAPGASTSSEIPEDEQDEMGISQGMIRMSIGLDNDIERTLEKMVNCFKKTKILS